MKSFYPFLLVAFCCFLALPMVSQDTFSIVACDPETGEIGAAGATCIPGAANIGGVIIINGIIPGRGTINGQATICQPHTNLSIGLNQMSLGSSPQEILDYLFQNDGCSSGDENNRQYGIVDFDGNGNPRAAAFTGANTMDHAGQRVGGNYAIQGNILLGPQILDSMEARFLAEDGPLAKKIMAAMQGANVPGADSRCLLAGTSSTTAFLRVARPNDDPNDLYLEINILEEPFGTEPINSLQAAFDEWADTALVSNVEELGSAIELEIYPNPSNGQINLKWNGLNASEREVQFLNTTGQLIYQTAIQNGDNSIYLPVKKDQLIFAKMVDKTGQVVFLEKIILKNE
ncbi:MAG: DUF1028 domain-containing protein [Bacteroidota bacterium]